MDTITQKFRIVFAGLAIIASLVLFSVMVTGAFGNTTVQAAGSVPSSGLYTVGMHDSPNVVASGMATATDELSQTLETVNGRMASLSNALHFTKPKTDGIAASTGTIAAKSQGLASTGFGSVRTVAATTGKFAAFGGNLYSRGAVSYVKFSAGSLASGLGLVAFAPVNFLGLVASTPVVSAAIRPADDTAIPIINPGGPLIFGAAAPLAALPAIIAPQQDMSPQWPIHGAVTTQFGVPHWPYQPTHTGIDISDGAPSGVTPVKPFRPGTVVEVVHEQYSLGNHVVVDHGNGLTSVYGHMYATSVSVGQQVDKGTTLGFEGSTGASTGTHLHFEVRENGQAVDPHKYVPGQP